MCASVYSSLLLFTLTTISIDFGAKMATEGLPLVRQERGADRGILAGADFLSVFMSSSLRQAYRETTTTSEPTTWEPNVIEPDEKSYTRATRSTSMLTSTAQAEEQTSFYETTISAQLQNDVKEQSSDSSSDDGVVVAVRVSSSVVINKEEPPATTTEYPDQNLVASEEHPSIVAEASKSEFSVEESEPITTNSDLTADFFKEYPASVQPVPRPFSLNKEKLQPIQQTVIYHDGPREPSRARSVSYSTVIQAVPHSQIDKHWEEEEEEKLDRRERHFDEAHASFGNSLHEVGDKAKNDTKTPHEPEDATTDSSTRRTSFTTERDWGLQEKGYARAHLPTVYGKPEQNYEVDESASVMTNGRVHGIQASPTLPSKQEVKVGESKKTDDNQKVGYVVEGRNYRKYRVEERTSDGFIVGEYGVFSHNDGSLRGVRYTADSTISPRLIYDALMKFLSL